MTRNVLILSLSLVLMAAGSAQPRNAAEARLSVLSKAGTPLPRPPVPVRYVALPPGAAAGTNYYYGIYGRAYGQSYAPRLAQTDSARSQSGIPGLVTRPRSSYGQATRSLTR